MGRPSPGIRLPAFADQCAHDVLVEERRDDERVMREPGFLHDPIDPGLAGEVRNVELAAADRFRIR
jgi:hypothetical protein